MIAWGAMQATGDSQKCGDQGMFAGFEIVIAYGTDKPCLCRAKQRYLSRG